MSIEVDLSKTPLDEHPEAWDELDMRLLKWMGIEIINEQDPWWETPSPSRMWEGFGLLIRECEKRGYEPYMERVNNLYGVHLVKGVGVELEVVRIGEHADPRAALALAVDKLPEGA